MEKSMKFSLILLLSFLMMLGEAKTQDEVPKFEIDAKKNINMEVNAKESKLAIIWSSGDRDVALQLVFLYSLNSKIHGWWDTIELIIWGPSAKLLADDEELQNKTQELQKAGVNISACKACTDSYQVTEDLEKLGIEVRYMGEPLTKYIKLGWKILTF